MIDSTLDFNSYGEGVTIAPGAPWSTNGVAPVALAAGAYEGARGAVWASTASAGRLQYDYGSAQTSRDVVAAGWFRLDTLATANLYINAVYSLPTGGTLQADWRVNTALTVSVRNSTTAVATSTATLAEDTWYWSEWRLSDTSDSQTLRIYDGAATTPLIELTGAYSSADTRTLAWGPNVAAATGAVSYDSLTLSDGWVREAVIPGPTVSPWTLDFDAYTDGDTPTASGPLSTSGTAPVVRTSAVRHGLRGITWDQATSGRLQYDYGDNVLGTLVTSAYIRLRALPSNNAYLMAIYSLPSGGSIQADWRINPDGTVSLRNAGAAVGTSLTMLQTSTWYRVEWRVDSGAGTQELRIFTGESATVLLSLAGAYGSTATRVATWGPHTAVTGGLLLDMDTLRLGPGWLGSAGTPVTETAWARKGSDGIWVPVYPQRGD